MERYIRRNFADHPSNEETEAQKGLSSLCKEVQSTMESKSRLGRGLSIPGAGLFT